MKNKVDIEKFEGILQIKFKDKNLLRRSLTHRSYLNENHGKNLKSNERLEFLGDAVLEIITTEYLFTKYPDNPEGDLTSFRSALVKTTSLGETALELGFGEFLFMSNGEEATGGRERPYILANTYEAVLGAIHLDQGYAVAKDFVERTLLPKLDQIVRDRLDIDAKSKLQEIAQEVLSYTPIYELVKHHGPDHDKEFEMAVKISGKEFGRGRGKSKQEAEQNAAQSALDNWEQLT